MERFEANALVVAEDDEEECFLVGLLEDPDIGESLIIQKATRFDPDEIAEEMNTYYVSLADGAMWYGGIESCILREDRLILILDPDIAKELEVDEGFEILLDLDDGMREELRQGLLRIFEGDPCRPVELRL